ncbi:hypothetical protein ACFQX7_24610 [Luedemannella flava]
MAGQLGPAMLESARRAFTDGVQLAAVASAVMLAITAVVAAIVLRRVTTSTGATH